MAFNPNNKIKDFYSRTNKLANDSNGLKISAERQYCEQLQIVGDFVVESSSVPCSRMAHVSLFYLRHQVRTLNTLRNL